MSNDKVFVKAHASHKAKKYGEAIKLYQMVLMKEPKHLDANYLLGTLYAETGKSVQAKKYLLKSEELLPSSPFIKVNLGNVYREEGDYETALICYINALQLQHDLPEAQQNLAAVTESMKEQKSEKGANSCLEYALSLIQVGRNDKALSILIIGNLLDPGNTYICYLKTVLEGKEPDKELQDAFDRLE